ncbi:MAG: TldD/PmbA family protein [Candidatus Aenigmarchaeota archaeon]|nr:TldD/PmbA family protein [Candidatus Aenigmarchaeota archaeon]
MEDITELTSRFLEKENPSYYEVKYQEDLETSYIFKNSQLYAISTRCEKGIGIRVLVNGSLGFGATNVLQKNSVENAVKESIKSARVSSRLRKTPIRFSEEKFEKKSWVIKPKISFEDVAEENKINLLREIDRIALDVAEEKKIELPARNIFLTEIATRKYFLNSDGAEISSEVPRIEIFWIFVGKKDGDSEEETRQIGGVGGWELIKRWKLVGEIKERIGILGNILHEAKLPPKGKIDVVMGGKLVGLAVHESTGHPYEADRILGRESAQAGESFVTPSLLGQRIGSELVTVVDDPTFIFNRMKSYGYYLWDEEGVKARRKILIKNGIINEFLHNRETAAKFGVKSNASARSASYSVEPLIRMSNTFMIPGDFKFNELLEGIKLGIYVKTGEEWNIDDRRFNMRNVGKEAYLIKNGELKNLVRRPVIEIKTPTFYHSIDAVDKNLDFIAATCGKGDPVQGVPVWCGGPNIRLRNIGVLGYGR